VGSVPIEIETRRARDLVDQLDRHPLVAGVEDLQYPNRRAVIVNSAVEESLRSVLSD